MPNPGCWLPWAGSPRGRARKAGWALSNSVLRPGSRLLAGSRGDAASLQMVGRSLPPSFVPGLPLRPFVLERMAPRGFSCERSPTRLLPAHMAGQHPGASRSVQLMPRTWAKPDMEFACRSLICDLIVEFLNIMRYLNVYFLIILQRSVEY